MRIEHLTISGPALASLLKELSTLRGPFDALLIGSFRVREEAQYDDASDSSTRIFLEAHISDICCSYCLGSFYNAAGVVEVEEVVSTAEQCGGQVLGWLVHQAGPRRSPSARERTVTAGMAACVPPKMPVIFGVVSLLLDQDGATATFQQQFHEQEAGSLLLRPIAVKIENLGSATQMRNYSALRAVPGLSKLSTSSGRSKAANTSTSDAAISQAAEAALNSQNRALESLLENLLDQMEVAGSQLTAETEDLKILQAELDSLAVR